jgi:hypothetical protein
MPAIRALTIATALLSISVSARSPARTPSSVDRAYPASVRAKVIQRGDQVFTVVYLHRDGTGRPAAEEPLISEAARTLADRAAQWAYARYRAEWSAPRPARSPDELVPPSFFDRMEEFNALVRNPREQILLFRGRGFDQQIGMIEFTHADDANPLSPAEQALGIRFARDRIAYHPDFGTYGRTIEINKVVTDPRYRGFAAPLLWSIAARESFLVDPYRTQLTESDAQGLHESLVSWAAQGEFDPKAIEGPKAGPADVHVGRLRLRCHKLMVKHYESLGFELDESPRQPLTDAEKGKLPAAQLGNPSPDDRVMLISIEDFYKIPDQLAKKPGAVFHRGRTEELHDAAWIHRELRATELRARAQSPHPRPRR